MINTKEILNAIKDAVDRGYRVFGIRALSDDQEGLQVGDHCRDSYDWDLEADCSTFVTSGETLNGACAVAIDRDGFFLTDFNSEDEDLNAIEAAVKDAFVYGEKLVVIGSKEGYEYGADENEIILEDADVLEAIE